jgi:hypothetical protein
MTRPFLINGRHRHWENKSYTVLPGVDEFELGARESKGTTWRLESKAHLRDIRVRIQKFPDWVDNEIYAYNSKHSLRSNAKGYGGKTH